MHKLVAAVQRRESEANVVVVDWLGLAHQLYPDAVNHTRRVGQSIATVLDWLQVRLYYPAGCVCISLCAFERTGNRENSACGLVHWVFVGIIHLLSEQQMSWRSTICLFQMDLFWFFVVGDVRSLPRALWVFSWNNKYSCIVAVLFIQERSKPCK